MNLLNYCTIQITQQNICPFLRRTVFGEFYPRCFTSDF